MLITLVLSHIVFCWSMLIYHSIIHMIMYFEDMYTMMYLWPCGFVVFGYCIFGGLLYHLFFWEAMVPSDVDYAYLRSLDNCNIFLNDYMYNVAICLCLCYVEKAWL